MESDDYDALHYSPPGPPPLPGDDLPYPSHAFTHFHPSHSPHSSHTLIHRPTPRRLPQRGLTPYFTINPYYLNVLHRIGPHSPLPVPLRLPKPTAHLERIEEGPIELVTTPHPSESTTLVSSLPEDVSGAAHDTAGDCSMASEMTEEGDASRTPTFLPTPPAEPSDDLPMDIDPPAQDKVTPPSGLVSINRPNPDEPFLLDTTPAPSSPTHSIPFESPPLSPRAIQPIPMVVDPPPPKRQAMRGNFRPPEQVAPKGAQWRTSKAPGHQGLTQKRKAESSSDNENDPHDIEVSAARILKRPFKPPTIVKQPIVRLKPRQPVAPITKPRMGPTRRLGTTLRAKPFIPPSKASEGSSVPPRSNSSGKAGRSGKIKAMDLNKTLITALETRLRALRNAVKHEESEDDGVVEGRIHTWRQAGREIADLLFALLPAPSEDRESRLPSSRWDDWGFGNDCHSDRLSKEQLEYLRTAPTDANGDVLDECGNRIFGDDGLRSFIDQAMSKDDYITAYEPDLVEHEPVAKVTHSVWDKGAMLLRLSVDPDLLGWDRDAEDWTEMAEWDG